MIVCSIAKSRSIQHILQPFLAARHGFLLNGEDSPESPEETPDIGVLLEIEDSLFAAEDGSSLEEEDDDRGLFEGESLVEEANGLLKIEDEGLLETDDDEVLAEEGESFFEEEGDSLSTTDDVPVDEEVEDCIDENAGFLDNVGVVDFKADAICFGDGLKEVER
jgi:hypothetical protein